MSTPCLSCHRRRDHFVHSRGVCVYVASPREQKQRARLNPRSAKRSEYLDSDEHREAMELSANATTCWPHAHGAPGECSGRITPSHTLSSGANGGLKVADRYPAPPACVWHNDAMEQIPEVRAWAEVTLFTHNGRQFPFKITREWLQSEREARG